MPYDSKDFFHYGKTKTKKQKTIHDPLETPLTVPPSFVWYLHTCCCFLTQLRHKVHLAKISRIISPCYSLLCGTLSCTLQMPWPPKNPTSVNSTNRNHSTLYLGSTFLTCLMRNLYGQYARVYYWAQFCSFSSLRNHCAVLTFVQCLKILVSYILNVF